jgi:hypothetical protein
VGDHHRPWRYPAGTIASDEYTRSISGELSPFPELAATWKTTVPPSGGAVHSTGQLDPSELVTVVPTTVWCA